MIPMKQLLQTFYGFILLFSILSCGDKVDQAQADSLAADSLKKKMVNIFDFK